MKSVPIVIDTDMGVDDIVAISMLLASPQFSIQAISTVFGVSQAKQGADNLARILTYAKVSIPIFQGNSRAADPNWNAAFPPNDCLRANQLTLLQQLPIPLKSNLPIEISLASLFSLIRNQVQPITLVCLGPLTNIAYLIQQYGNEFTQKIDQIVMMGGAVTCAGNVPPLKIAEYNIYLDPEAAKTVFASSMPITQVPIDATAWVPAVIKNNNTSSRLQSFLASIRNKQFTRSESQLIQAILCNNLGDFDSFYDPLVAALMLEPSLIQSKFSTGIEVVIRGLNRGQTRNVKSKKNVEVITKVNADKFYQLMERLLR